MSRPKGMPKTGGRQKGTQNRVSVQVKEWLTSLIYRNRKTLEQDLATLEPKDRLMMLEKLMAYCVPKLQAQTIEAQLNEARKDPYLGMTLEQINAEIARLDALEEESVKGTI